MSYIKKQSQVVEGDDAAAIKDYVEDNHETAAKLLMGTDSSAYVDDANVVANAGIREQKICNNIDRHPHFGKLNMGERVLGDRQFEWRRPGANQYLDGMGAGVMLVRTYRPGMKIIHGVTGPLTVPHEDLFELGGEPPNATVRVDFASVRGSSGPFSVGAQVSVGVTPQAPPYTWGYDSGIDAGVVWMLLGSDWKGFDLWVCTRNMSSAIIFFSYIAVGWEVI